MTSVQGIQTIHQADADQLQRAFTNRVTQQLQQAMKQAILEPGSIHDRTAAQTFADLANATLEDLGAGYRVRPAEHQPSLADGIILLEPVPTTIEVKINVQR